MVLAEDIEDITFQVIEEAAEGPFDYEKRIEYSRMVTNRQLAELDIKNTRVQYIPRLDFYGNIGATAGTENLGDFLSFNTDPWFGVGTVGIRMKLPIFDGFFKHNVIQEKRIKAAQIENGFAAVKNSIDLEIQQATDRLHTQY